MKIGGIEKLTLIDFPDALAAIIFTQGCNFRCQFCYNPMLVWPSEVGELKYERDHSEINENDLFDFLIERRDKLDGVVITGGEPTLHPDLPEFIKKIRDLGYKIKLDSNGTNPQMLSRLFEERLVDYVAMDIKAPLEKYELITQVKLDWENIKQSIELIMNSGVPYEFRSTLPPELLNKADIEKMGELIKGAGKWYLQFFKSDTDLVNRELENHGTYSTTEMAELVATAKQYVKFCEARG